MPRRLVGWLFLPATLVLVILAAFSSLVADPSGLIVDSNRPSVDTHVRGENPSVGNDLTRQYLPRLVVHARAISEFGRLPSWDDTGFGGRPAIGNPQSSRFYPPVWPVWWLGHPAGLGWLTLAHLVWTGVGVIVLGRASGLNTLTSLVASVCVQISPYVILQAYEGHYPHLWTFSWYPWAFWATLKLRDVDWRSGLSLVPILALGSLAGHAQEWFYLVLCLVIWVGGDVVWKGFKSRLGEVAGGSFKMMIAQCVILLAMIGFALGIAAIEIIPAVFCEPWTLKGARHTVAEASAYHIDWINILQWISPIALGGPSDYIGPHNAWETQFGFGFPVLWLAAIAMTFSTRRRAVLAWFGLLLVAIWFAAGSKLGLFSIAYYFIPGMDRFRVPARSLFLANLAISMLAAHGFEALRMVGDQRRNWQSIGRFSVASTALIILLLLVVKLGIANTSESLRSIHALKILANSPIVWWILGSTTLLVLLVAALPEFRKIWAFGFIFVICYERIDYAQGVIVVAPLTRVLGSDPIANAIEVPRNTFRIRSDDKVYDDLHAFHAQLMKTSCYDAFQIQYAADLYETLYPMFENRPYQDKVGPMVEAVTTYRREVRQNVLDRMAVQFLVTSDADSVLTWPVITSGIWNQSTYKVFRNLSALPRAYVVPRALPSPESKQAILSAFRQVDPHTAVFMRRDPLSPEVLDRQPYTPAKWCSTDPDHVVIQVETTAPGLLVIADTFMPGWSATVDGITTSIERGNHAQRVVPITTSGFHEIRLDYDPPGFRLGLAITTAMCTALGVLSVLSRRVSSRDHLALETNWTSLKGSRLH